MYNMEPEFIGYSNSREKFWLFVDGYFSIYQNYGYSFILNLWHIRLMNPRT